MKPSAFGEEVADILTQTCKRVFRQEDLTLDELDTISDRILQLTAREQQKIRDEAGPGAPQ